MNRLDKIYKYLQEANRAVSGSELSERFNISRQIIVQEIALLRAKGYDIISTNRGYIISENPVSVRLCLAHENEDMIKELYAIVDNGGTIKNVIIDHPVYEEIVAPLNLSNRKEVDEFVAKMNRHQGLPLKHLGDGFTHYHEITAPSQEVIDNIVNDLSELGFLVEK